MPANIKEPVSVSLWFQSLKGRPHGGFMPSGAPTFFGKARSGNHLRRIAHHRAIFSRLMSEAET